MPCFCIDLYSYIRGFGLVPSILENIIWTKHHQKLLVEGGGEDMIQFECVDGKVELTGGLA